MRREFFERQCRRQSDGTYLARPYGRLGGVYEIDAATKERHVDASTLQGKIALALMIVAIPISQIFGLSMWYFVGVAVLLAVIATIRKRFLFANAQKVPATRWEGPAVADSYLMFPRWYLRLGLALGVVMTLVVFFAAFTELRLRNQLSTGSVVLGLLFLWGTGFSWYQLRRRTRFERVRSPAPSTRR
jgi:drug/metabolite transporter (DMT)-like permease